MRLCGGALLHRISFSVNQRNDRQSAIWPFWHRAIVAQYGKTSTQTVRVSTEIVQYFFDSFSMDDFPHLQNWRWHVEFVYIEKQKKKKQSFWMERDPHSRGNGLTHSHTLTLRSRNHRFGMQSKVFRNHNENTEKFTARIFIIAVFILRSSSSTCI